MIGVTHPGKIGDFAYCLPICSWLYKTTKEKILFIFPTSFPFMRDAEDLLKRQAFTGGIVYCDFEVNNYDMGGQPYIFDPNEYLPNLKLSKYYNFGFRSAPDKYITDFYAEEYGLGIDEDFILDIGLPFTYKNDRFMCSELLCDIFPSFELPNFDRDFLSNLQDLARAKERHLHFSSLAVFLSLAKVPFHLYILQKHQPFVDMLDNPGLIRLDPEKFWLYFKDAPILDVRELNLSYKIKSIYDKIFFK